MSAQMVGAYYVLVSGIIPSQCFISFYPQEVGALISSHLQTVARILKGFSNLPEAKDVASGKPRSV